MKIHSDTLTFQDILECVPRGCYLASFEHPHIGYTNIGFEGSRKREHGYVVRLAGSSPYRMQRLPDKSATWDEWGIFIAAIYERDPDAVVGWYKTRAEFIEITTKEHERISTYRPDLLPTHRAPWLETMVT